MKREPIYDVIRSIPRGRVMGYGHVAAALGHPGAARQVGYALAALPAGSEVPWHRVLRSSGHLAYAGDPARPLLQRRLLELEGVAFTGETVDRAAFWLPP